VASATGDRENARPSARAAITESFNIAIVYEGLEKAMGRGFGEAKRA
jgi:hypothetical protein